MQYKDTGGFYFFSGWPSSLAISPWTLGVKHRRNHGLNNENFRSLLSLFSNYTTSTLSILATSVQYTVMPESESKFPEVKGGGSLILAWQIKNKHVLVVGGGEVSPTYIPEPPSLPTNRHASDSFSCIILPSHAPPEKLQRD